MEVWIDNARDIEIEAVISRIPILWSICLHCPVSYRISRKDIIDKDGVGKNTSISQICLALVVSGYIHICPVDIRRLKTIHIEKVRLDGKTFNAMMRELEREKELVKVEKIYNERTREAKLQEIDEQLARLLDLFAEASITADEYKAKKASLINKKHTI